MSKTTYKEFISNIIKTRGQHGALTEYFERHHIIPKCCNGTDDKENIIELLPEEHYEAHYLLAKENPNNDKLKQAFACMSFTGKTKYKVTAEEFGEARRIQSMISSSRLKGVVPGIRKGIPHTEETKQKLREANKKYKPTKEAIQKQSLAQTGRKLSDETKEKIRAKLKGRVFDNEFRRKCSISKIGNQNAKGHVLSQESKDRIIQSRKENNTYYWTEKHWETFRNNPDNFHWKLSEATKQRISESRKGIEFSEEHKKHLSESLRGIRKPQCGKYERNSQNQWKTYKKKLLNGTYFSNSASPHKGELIHDYQLEYVIQTCIDKVECSEELVPKHFIDVVVRLFSRLGKPDIEEAQEIEGSEEAE